MDPARLRDILRRQKIHVAEDDPVLAVGAICDAALAETLATIEARVAHAANEITCAAVQEREAAKALAEKVISSAGAWSADQLREATDEMRDKLLAAVRSERAETERHANTAKVAAYVACFAAAMPFLWQLGVWIGNRLPVPLF